MTDVLTDAATEAPPAAGGFREAPRYRTIEAPSGSPWDGTASGSAPLSITVRSNLFGAELDRLRWARDRAIAEKDDRIVFEAVAPYVTAWNAEAPVFDPETGELEWRRLPPPAEAGWEVLAQVDWRTALYVVTRLITAPVTLGEALAPPSTPSDGRRDGAPSETPPGAADAPSPTPSRRSRRAPTTSSPTPSGST